MGVHVAPLDAVAVTLATDIFHGTVAADKTVRLVEMVLGQTTDLGDANEEVLRIGVYRGVTGGSGGTALTEVPLNGGDAASSLTVLGNNSTASTGGTLIGIIPWNIRIPLLWCPVPEVRPTINPALDPVAFRLLAAPTDSITVSGHLIWEELY